MLIDLLAGFTSPRQRRSVIGGAPTQRRLSLVRVVISGKMISMRLPPVLQVAAMRFCSAAIVYDERVCKFISSSAARPASP